MSLCKECGGTRRVDRGIYNADYWPCPECQDDDFRENLESWEKHMVAHPERTIPQAKIANARVAKALGWKVREYNDHGMIRESWSNAKGEYEQAPDFMWNLNRVTKAVKAKGPDYEQKILKYLISNGRELWDPVFICQAINTLKDNR